jgi:ribosomal protein S12 methylthiotransferase
MLDLPRVSFVSLGCPKNLVSSEVILGRFVEGGFYICEDPEDSDLIVINTCAFLREAEEESMEVIKDAVMLKDRGKVKGVIVIGCLPQRYGERLKGDLKGVDAILQVDERDKIVKTCGLILNSCSPGFVPGTSEEGIKPDKARLRLTLPHLAYVRIAEGCEHTCTFCVIPKIKGRYRSKPAEMILDEVRELVSDGAKEINLIAQDTSSYGIDLYGRFMLPELLQQISELEGVKWIRILYTYPTTVTKRLIKEIADNPKVVKYIDLPIQHTNDKILQGMKRGINAVQQRDLIEFMREQIPGLFIRTSIIVGFPGEQEDEFRGLLIDLARFRFERLGVFRYSPEFGTLSYDMQPQVSEEEKRRRFEEVMSLQQGIAFDNNERLVGSDMEAIVEKRAQDQEYPWEGRTYGDAPDVDGVILLKGKGLKPGQIVQARIVGSRGYDLIGVVE